MNQNHHSEDKYHIQVLQRALRLLEALLQAGQPLSLEQVSRAADVPQSTAFRILANLLRAGYIVEQPEGYWLGLKLLSLGSAVESRLDLTRIAEPQMNALRDLTRETVYLATLTHDFSVLYLGRAGSPQPVSVSLNHPGMTAQPHCTGLGKVLLAFQPEHVLETWLPTATLTPQTPYTLTSPDALRAELDAVRARGYATDNEQHLETICCIAAPVFNAHREVVAAISVAGPKDRMPQPLEDSPLAAQILDAARQISAQLGLQLPLVAFQSSQD